MKKKLGFKVLGLVVFSLLLAVNCAEEGTAPDENIPPNTFITNYQIEIGPDSATAYTTDIYWSGNDVDGAIFWYEWSAINATGDSLKWYIDTDGVIDTVNISEWQTTNTLSMSILLDFPNFDTKYIFRVRAMDNDREVDPTPAVDTISIDRIRDFNYAPNTDIVEGPKVESQPNITTSGIHFIVRGMDIDGAVEFIEYMVDTQAEWTQESTDITTSTLTFDITDLTEGPHTISFRSVDNFGKVDPSPYTVSVVVDTTLRPDLTIVSGPIPNAYYYLPAGGTSLDLAAEWSGSAAWYFSSVQYQYAVDDTTTWSDLMDGSTATLMGLSATSHEFYVKAIDLAGNASVYKTDFAVGAFVGDQGVLVMNGIHQGAYGAEFDDFWNGVDFEFDFDFWDAFGGQDYSSIPTLDDAYIGNGILDGSTLSHYSSFVMIMNGYNGDLEVYQAMFPLIMSYLNAGGNVYLGTRYATSNIYGDLETYAHIDSWDQEGVILDPGIVAAVEGLINIDGADLAGSDLPAIPTDPEVTVIFTHPSYPNAAAGIYVEPSATGKFAFISGRPYRYNQAAYGDNVNYIVDNYFGEGAE